jgi:transposase
LALAAIYDGGSRTRAAELGGVSLQVVRDWALRFNTHGPGGLIDRKAPGQPPRLKDEQSSRIGGDGRKWPDPCRARSSPLADYR